MANATKMDQFKYALYRFSGFTKEQIEDISLVKSIDTAIKKLLNDELMMKNKNHHSLEERTNLVKISLYRDLFVLAAEDHLFKSSYKEKIDELKNLIG